MVFPSSFFCRMIAFDLDGTLLQQHSVLSKKARAMLEQAAGLGILPVSGYWPYAHVPAALPDRIALSALCDHFKWRGGL